MNKVVAKLTIVELGIFEKAKNLNGTNAKSLVFTKFHEKTESMKINYVVRSGFNTLESLFDN